MYTSTFLHIRQMLDIVHIRHRIHTALSLSLSLFFSFSHSICAYVYMKTVVKNIYDVQYMYIYTNTHATHSHGHTHAHLHARTSYRDSIKSSRWRVMIETLFQDVYNTYQKRFRLPTEPSLILGAEWILAPGPWVENYFTSCDPHHDIYTCSYWHIFWHSI